MIEAKMDVLEDEAVATVKNDDVIDGRLVEQLIGRARKQGVALTGEGGLLGRLTKLVLESALEGEITEHLAYHGHERDGSPRYAGSSARPTQSSLSTGEPVKPSGPAVTSPRSKPL